MVLLIKFPNLKSSNLWIEEVFRRKYKTKRIPLHKFFSAEEAKVLTKLSSNTIIKRLSKSKKFHALVWNGKLYIHPDAIMYLFRAKIKSAISKALKV